MFLIKEKKALENFYNLVHHILDTITTDGAYHPYAPIVLYHIITANTKALLEGETGRIWDKLTQSSRTARVDSMTSLTGRKAAVNLVLYSKLCQILAQDKKICTIDQKPSATKISCKTIRKQRFIQPKCEACIFSKLNDKEAICPYGVHSKDLMNFMFALITGYGQLFHHYALEPTSMISAAKLMISKVDYAKESFEAFSYRPDYRHPVDELGYEINANINACFANRPEFLATSVPKRGGRMGLASLSNLILQDMAMPARQRISRLIQKSMNQEILEKYRPYLYYPYERNAVISCLDDIIKTYFQGIENLMIRYHDFGTESLEYNYRDALRALIEYEIRHLLYEEGKSALIEVAKLTIPKHMFSPKTNINKGKSGKSGRSIK